MTKKTWARPTVTPLAAAKDAQLLTGTTSDGLTGKQASSGS
ncbi:MAG TPA: hypothetical protein VN088_11945 [Nocardioides sp.]|nr:hypothetical protein [Nocardioides sp.]